LAEEKTRTGSCLCGGIAFTITGPIRNIITCYCAQCRKTSGNYVAASNCSKDQLTFLSDKTLTWYQSSKELRRGFCNRCGSNVLIDVTHNNTYSLPAGVLDQPTGLRTIAEIYVDQRPDYLEHHTDVARHNSDFVYDENWENINESKN
jgi:hypothetical protein